MNGGPADQLLKAFTIPTQQLAAEAFCSAMMTSDQVLDLFGSAVQFALAEKPPFPDPDPAVLDSMRRMLNQQPPAQAKLQVAISEALRTATGVSLRVASSLMNQFLVPGEWLLAGDAVDAVRKAFWADLRTTFSGEQGPHKLVAASTWAPAYALIWCSWGLDRIRAGTFDEVPFEGWNEFAATAIAATVLDPGVMLPQLVPFLVDRHDHFPQRQEVTYSYNPTRANRLFDMTRLVRVILAAPEPADARIKEMLRAVRREMENGSSTSLMT